MTTTAQPLGPLQLHTLALLAVNRGQIPAATANRAIGGSTGDSRHGTFYALRDRGLLTIESMPGNWNPKLLVLTPEGEEMLRTLRRCGWQQPPARRKRKRWQHLMRGAEAAAFRREVLDPLITGLAAVVERHQLRCRAAAQLGTPPASRR